MSASDLAGFDTSERCKTARVRHERAKSAPVARRKKAVNERRQDLIRERLDELNEDVRAKHRLGKKAWSVSQEQSYHALAFEEPLQRFRRICNIVLTLTRVFLFIRETRFEVDDLIKKNQEIKKPGCISGYDSLDFDPNLYRAIREYTWPGTVLGCIMRPPRVRSDQDCARIRDVMRTLSSFRKYTEDMQALICKVAEYSKCGKNRVIVRKGHPGLCFYFIFSGSLCVVFEAEEASMFTRPDTITLYKGDVFGEVALLKDTVRNATVVSATECELLQVDRTAFVEFGLYDLFMEKCQFMIKFISDLDLFRTWSAASVEELSFLSRMENYNYMKVIVRDARTCNWLYVVGKGSCQVMRMVDLTTSSDFARLVPKKELEALQDSFSAVFFDLKSLHQFVTTIQKKEESRRKHGPPSRGPVSPNLLNNFSSCNINSQSLHSLSKLDPNTVHRSATAMSTQERSSTELSGRSSVVLYNVGTRPGSAPPDQGRKTSSSYIAEATANMKKRAGAPKKQRRYAVVPGLHLDEFTGIAAFVKVETLVSGDIFGFHSESNGPLALVSKGVELIRIPISQFRSMSDDATNLKVQQLSRKYPSEKELCTRIFKMAKWNIFRSNLGDSVRWRSSMTGAPGIGNYLRRKESAYTLNSALSGHMPMMTYTPNSMPDTDDSLPKSPTKLRMQSAVAGGQRRYVTIATRPKTSYSSIRSSTTVGS